MMSNGDPGRGADVSPLREAKAEPEPGSAIFIKGANYDYYMDNQRR
jgi:hypothetical protein